MHLRLTKLLPRLTLDADVVALMQAETIAVMNVAHVVVLVQNDRNQNLTKKSSVSVA
jgi:hypothetical protein